MTCAFCKRVTNGWNAAPQEIRIGLTIIATMATLAIFMALLVIAAYVMTFYAWPPSNSQAIWGQFGDYLGGVLNPIFGFLSFLAILVALVLQSHELKQSTKQLEASAMALKMQNDSTNLQNFENTFFKLLSRYSDVVSNIQLDRSEGKIALRELVIQLGYAWQERNDVDDGERRAVLSYEAFYSLFIHELGPLFRTLYHIFTFIDRSYLTDDKKRTYASIARAQLSSDEIALLFYNCLTGEGKEGFKPLVEKYSLLKHIDPGKLVDESHLSMDSLFLPSAFGGVAT